MVDISGTDTGRFLQIYNHFAEYWEEDERVYHKNYCRPSVLWRLGGILGVCVNASKGGIHAAIDGGTSRLGECIWEVHSCCSRGVSASWMHPPPVNRMTHACENITLAVISIHLLGAFTLKYK